MVGSPGSAISFVDNCCVGTFTRGIGWVGISSAIAARVGSRVGHLMLRITLRPATCRPRDPQGRYLSDRA